MAINVEQVVQFFWNGLTKTEEIDTRNNYVQMEVGIKFLDSVVNNGWMFQTTPGDYLTPQIINQIVQGIATKINSYISDNPGSNPLVLKVHSPGVGDRNNILRQYEFYNVNNLVPYMSIVVTLGTMRAAPKFFTTILQGFDESTGAISASGLDFTDVTNVPDTSANLATSADFDTAAELGGSTSEG